MINNIYLQNISKKYKDKIVFQNINFIFIRGKINIIKGSNGSEKTTLLNIIANLDTNYNGNINLDNLKNNNQICSLYIQNNNLYSYLTVVDNLKLILDDESLIDSYLNTTNLMYLKYQNISSLSKGEKQRIALIKILISKFEILLLDEPFSSLDNENKNLFFNLLKEKAKEKIVIVALNNQSEIKIENENILFLNSNNLEKNNIIIQEKKYNTTIKIKITKAYFFNTLFHFYKSNIVNLIFTNFLFALLFVILNAANYFSNDLTNNEEILFFSQRDFITLVNVIYLVLEFIINMFILSNIKTKLFSILKLMYLDNINIRTSFLIFFSYLCILLPISFVIGIIITNILKIILRNNTFLISCLNVNLFQSFLFIIIYILQTIIGTLYLTSFKKTNIINQIRLDSKSI